MNKIVSVVACNSLKISAGEISRLAAYRLEEIEKPHSTFLLGLPGLDVGKDQNVYAVDHFPQVAIEGCDRQCATRILERYNAKHIETLIVPDILNDAGLELKEITVSPLSSVCMEAVKRVARSAASVVGAFIENYPMVGADQLDRDTYTCSACGWVYTMKTSDPDYGVIPGTTFDKLPDDWSCPICAVPSGNFEPTH